MISDEIKLKISKFHHFNYKIINLNTNKKGKKNRHSGTEPGSSGRLEPRYPECVDQFSKQIRHSEIMKASLSNNNIKKIKTKKLCCFLLVMTGSDGGCLDMRETRGLKNHNHP